MYNRSADQFLVYCKQNYFDKITPANRLAYENDNSKELIRIAKRYFDNNRYDEFAGFFQESQYFVQLWAAHLLLEFGSPPQEIISLALKTIKEYSNNPLAAEVAKQEKEWLIMNASKYH